MIKLNSGITTCPKCGNKDDFYIKARATGITKINHMFDGEHADNDNLWDEITLSRKNNAYCGVCDFNLGGWAEE